ncbi:MAG TPA: GcrA family cell cycle regulator [Dongiaceae bacterium]
MSDRLALANAIEDAGIERSEAERVAVGKVKLGDRNRAIVERLAAGASTRAVGAEFGLTPTQIGRIRMQVTGVRQRPAYAPWPAERVTRLRLLWRRGLSAAEIGRLLGMSKSAVVGKIDRLELPPPSAELQARKRRRAGRPPFWVARRIARLRKLWGTLSHAAIARELGISKAAVFRQARRLALPPRSPRPHATRHAGPPLLAACPWTPAELLAEGEAARRWKPA